MRLTNHFIRKKVKALAGQSGKRQSNFCTLKDARHILVLFNAEDRDVVEPCLKTLRTLNKNVNVCVYVSCHGENIPFLLFSTAKITKLYHLERIVCK